MRWQFGLLSLPLLLAIHCGRYDLGELHGKADGGTFTPPAVVPGDVCSPVRVPDQTAGVFVNGANGTDADECGSQASPCQTIRMGVSRAKSSGKSVVYVAAGQYSEVVELSAGVRVEGAWRVDAGSWVSLCGAAARQAVKIHAPASSSVTVLADDLGGTAVLASLSVLSADTPPVVLGAPGASRYGVVARGASTALSLEDVAVLVASAGEGADGSAVVSGAPGAADGCAVASDGADGQVPGKAGRDASSGTFGPQGYAPTSGESGTDGEPGHNGLAPTVAPTCATGCGVCKSSTSCVTTADSCGTAGKVGCAGGAGRGGDGARGGGSSIGLYVWDATVTVTASFVQAGNGGQAGRRGLEGDAGRGALGLSGQSATCNQCSVGLVSNSYSGGVFACTTTPVATASAGGPGGKGGNGTAGGRGGKGRGGSSCAAYRNPAATLTLLDGTSLSFGLAGNSPEGNQLGLAAEVCP